MCEALRPSLPGSTISTSAAPGSTLGSDGLDLAVQVRAPQPPNPDPQHDRPPVGWHVRDRPLAEPVHQAGQPAAPRARHRNRPGPRPDRDHILLVGHVLYDQGRQPGKHYRRKIINIAPGRPCHM